MIKSKEVLALYLSKALDSITDLPLISSQRNYLLVKPTENVIIQEASAEYLKRLPEPLVSLTYLNSNLNLSLDEIKGTFPIVNINEIIGHYHNGIFYKLKISCLNNQFEKMAMKTTNLFIYNREVLLEPTSHQVDLLQSIDPIELGIGGVSKEFETIFTSLFLPFILQEDAETYELVLTRVCLLYGPPGTGKTAMAIDKRLQVDNTNVQLINGPELSNKYISQTEENVRTS